MKKSPNRSGILVLALSLSLFASSAAYGRDLLVNVGEVKGEGVSEEKLATVRSLIRAEVSRHPDARLVETDGDLTMSAELMKLERNFLVLVSGVEKGGGSRSQKAKIESFDEIDTALSRLVAAVIEDKPLEETAERGVVLEKEQKEPARVKSVAGPEVFLGAAWPISNALESHRTMYSLGAGYMWDITPWLIELRADFQAGINEITMNTSSITFGGHYIWLQTRQTAVYSGAEIGFAHVEDNLFSGKSGFGIVGNTGLLLLRHADINVDLRARILMLADKFNGAVPVIGTFLVGVHF